MLFMPFYQGTLMNEVYMMQPPGFVHPQFSQHIYNLKKALYRLKQSPKGLVKRVKFFTNIISDASLFIYNKDGIIV